MEEDTRRIFYRSGRILGLYTQLSFDTFMLPDAQRFWIQAYGVHCTASKLMYVLNRAFNYIIELWMQWWEMWQISVAKLRDRPNWSAVRPTWSRWEHSSIFHRFVYLTIHRHIVFHTLDYKICSYLSIRRGGWYVNNKHVIVAQDNQDGNFTVFTI